MISDKKIKEWINTFLEHIKEVTSEVHVREAEGYKFKAVDTFQRNFNIDALDLPAMLDRSIEDNNMVASNWYFPKKMLIIFAKEYEKETREALSFLFDENKPVTERIDNTEAEFERLMAERNKKINGTDHSFINLRFLSLLLSYRYPDKYNALKMREWNMFCKFVDEDFRIPRGIPKGERYEMIEEYVEVLRSQLKRIPEIQQLRDQLTRGLEFKDEEFRWMTQDVIYVTARVIANKKGEEGPQQVVAVSERMFQISGEASPGALEFSLEEYLENFIIKNWDNIDFGEKLSLFIDDEGTPAQQYPTSEGFIDLLAKDSSGNFVVIELKKGRENAKVVGQILSYVGWVKNNLAEEGRKVRGIIIAADGNNALHDAVSTVSNFISVKYYRVKFNFESPHQGN